jgi:hypothetical protein
VNKVDKVTDHFYNVDDVKTERHSFTMGDPYKVDIDLGSGQMDMQHLQQTTADYSRIIAGIMSQL